MYTVPQHMARLKFLYGFTQTSVCPGTAVQHRNLETQIFHVLPGLVRLRNEAPLILKNWQELGLKNWFASKGFAQGLILVVVFVCNLIHSQTSHYTVHTVIIETKTERPASNRSRVSEVGIRGGRDWHLARDKGRAIGRDFPSRTRG